MMRVSSIRLVLCVTFGILASAAGIDAAPRAVMAIQFASEMEGQDILAKKDRFLTTLSPFDRQSRLEAAAPVDEAQFVAFLRSNVRPWNEVEKAHILSVFEKLWPKLVTFHLPLPKSIWLVKTTGREEGNAAYCRQLAIVLPQDKVSMDAAALERLLTHELFHILTAQDADFRQKCYALIGFQVVEPIPLPEPLLARKITNPDGPLPDAIIEIMTEGKKCSAVPVLYSEQPFDPARGGPFFKYLTFRLLAVEKSGQTWRAVEQNGAPQLLVPTKTPDFTRQIGANTGYIIHPDEILAENFVHLVFQTPQLRTPQIIESFREALVQ